MANKDTSTDTDTQDLESKDTVVQSSGTTIDTTSDSLESSPSATVSDPEASTPSSDAKPSKLPKPLHKYSHRINIWLLMFILVLVIAGAVVAVSVMTGRKQTKTPEVISNQALSADTLKQLANTNATVGDPKQTLNVQSNAVFAGKVLVRDSLDVAGTINVGGALALPGITVSGDSNFETVNVARTLGIGGDASVQGQLNVRRNIAVSGGGTFGGPVTAPQISTSTLQLLGDLTLTRHIIAGGPTPGNSNGNALGGGGTSSVSGSDTTGSINLNTGSSPPAGCFININFTQRFTKTPHVLLTPVGSAASTINYYVNRSTAGFSVCTTNSAPAGASFGFDYFVLE